MEEPNFWTLLFGAALAASGGLITQLILNSKTKKDAKKALLVGITSELQVMRQDFITHIVGVRVSLRDDEQLPRPDDFSASTVVFDANAGSLGQLGDPDLVEHLVQVYSTVHHLKDEANRFRSTPNNLLQRYDVEVYHSTATTTHLGVMKLHNTLSRGKDSGPHNIHDTEEETRELVKVWHERLARNPASFDPSYPLASLSSEPSD